MPHAPWIPNPYEIANSSRPSASVPRKTTEYGRIQLNIVILDASLIIRAHKKIT